MITQHMGDKARQAYKKLTTQGKKSFREWGQQLQELKDSALEYNGLRLMLVLF